jgi:hypothetical protein
LDAICKSYEANKKIRKRKEEKKIKILNGPRGDLSAQIRNQPVAHLTKFRTGTLSPSFPR